MSNSQSNKMTKAEIAALDLTDSDQLEQYFAATEPETPKKPTNATNLNISKSHALFKPKNNPESESSTIIEEGLSGSIKRKCRERQGPTNAGPKTRKVIIAAVKSNKQRDARSDKEAIEYYKNLVIEESLVKLEQAKQINVQLTQLGNLTEVIHKIGLNCSVGLTQVENITNKPRPMAISLSRCHNDPVLANIHNGYVNRISQVGQQNEKITYLMKTIGTIIDDCSSGLQLVKPTLVRSSTRSQTKKIHISHPPQKKLEKGKIETEIEIKTEVQTQTHVDYSNIEIDLPDNISSEDKETWELMKRRHRFAASEKARLENDLLKFKNKLSEKRSEDMDFSTFNISQENIENQNSTTISKPPNTSFKKFLGVNLPSAIAANPTSSQSASNSQQQPPASMKVETGCSNSTDSE